MERSVAVLSTNENANVRRRQLHIPNDLSFSILSKLPIKSLKRFGCVRKSWSLLFDNPYFMTMYRNTFLTNDHSYYDDTSLLIHQTFEPWDGNYWDDKFELYSVSGERFENRVKFDWPMVTLDRPYPRPEYDSGFNILGYGSVAHGTLCLVCALQVTIVLWNPSTNEFKVIPPSPFDSRSYWDVSVYHQGFGYGRVRDDYKVMRYMSFFRKINCDLDVLPGTNISFNSSIWEIYSLRSNSWRKLDVDMHHEPMDDEELQMDNEQLYVDGLSHWMCKSQKHNETYLLSFDWSNEVFLTTPLPSDVNDIFMSVFLSVWSHLVLLNGSIALILNYRETATFHISILGELGVKESWTKIFIIGPLPCLEYPIGAGKKGDMLFRKKDGELVWFDLNTQMTEDLGIFTEKFYCKIVIHKESLLPF